MALVKWIKVQGVRQFYDSESVFMIQMAEVEVLDVSGVKFTPDSAAACSSYSASYHPGKLIDGSGGTSWSSSKLSSASVAWCALRFVPSVEAAKVRLLPFAPYFDLGFRNATILGSIDSTDGVDGTWVVLATGVNMATTAAWTEHPLSDWVEAASSRPPLPAILSCLPASLARGFR